MKEINLSDTVMENQNRPVTTLFMLMSVDGKISTGATDELDLWRKKLDKLMWK